MSASATAAGTVTLAFSAHGTQGIRRRAAWLQARRAAKTDRIGFALDASARRLAMTVGPFRPGTEALLRGDDPVIGSKSPLALLSDELRCVPDDFSERLQVVMIDHRK